MPDYRMFEKLVDQLPPRERDSFWAKTWEERAKAVHRLLGQTDPPGMVHPFSWKDYILPGACALTFKPTPSNSTFLYMTLGLTQPVSSDEPAYPWEFCVRTRVHAQWPIDLLYQFLTQWHWTKGEMWFGYHLPLVFFTDGIGTLWGGLTDKVDGLNIVGSLRAVYLWADERCLSFNVSTGDFGLLTMVAVTEDEDNLAEEATPAHLMLLLRRMGIDQICDPHRQSVLSLPGAYNEWADIKGMSHESALAELQKRPS